MNKLFVTFIIPTLEIEFEAYIPNNKKVGTIKGKILSYIREISNGAFMAEEEDIHLFDKDSGLELINDAYVKDTSIKNASKIIVIQR